MQISDLIPWGRDRNKTPASGDDRPDNPLAALQRDINHVFEDFWQRLENGWNGRTNPAGGFGPSTDISESGDSVEVAVELPGMSEDDIGISLSGDAMTIRGEKKIAHEEKRKGVYMSERSYGAFYRTIPLPPGADTGKADAQFRNGVLTVTLPKSPEAQAKVKRIKVKSS
ncbi:Hsp20/alpha crystallin family protein [Leisingera methylohalidivorans]|uniref:Heat shock protein Hsp20 n=1 Tax=Leisingera methylohalidivorans DSM 14336 TaxID=999552 RepID=V9VVG6_9RHOB|nr:Hsp20/alpha crystallin family protein [Leisingera methylohalidivorans]AHD00867.1 heat shock protein Hsp20 [Leisingera methylohalidivorans DSM 14336]